ncbi:MAG: DUF3077 domain-containing protein [Candidatus Accumulibacter phosphatis]|jgi:hypothetical protein
MRTDTNEQADFQPKPYFATAGNPAQFFVVSDDTTTECALEGASMFLSSAVSLGSDSDALDDGARWAIVHLVEMAKALVDSVVEANMEAPRPPATAAVHVTARHSTIELERDTVQMIRRALLIGLSSFGEVERVRGFIGTAKVCGREIPDDAMPLHPTDTDDVAGIFADALRFLEHARSN